MRAIHQFISSGYISSGYCCLRSGHRLRGHSRQPFIKWGIGRPICCRSSAMPYLDRSCDQEPSWPGARSFRHTPGQNGPGALQDARAANRDPVFFRSKTFWKAQIESVRSTLEEHIVPGRARAPVGRGHGKLMAPALPRGATFLETRKTRNYG